MEVILFIIAVGLIIYLILILKEARRLYKIRKYIDDVNTNILIKELDELLEERKR